MMVGDKLVTDSFRFYRKQQRRLVLHRYHKMLAAQRPPTQEELLAAIRRQLSGGLMQLRNCFYRFELDAQDMLVVSELTSVYPRVSLVIPRDSYGDDLYALLKGESPCVAPK